jgi:hypothetical protein
MRDIFLRRKTCGFTARLILDFHVKFSGFRLIPQYVPVEQTYVSGDGGSLMSIRLRAL